MTTVSTTTRLLVGTARVPTRQNILYRFLGELRLYIDRRRTNRALTLRRHLPAALAVLLLLAATIPMHAQRFPGPLPVPGPSGGRVPTTRAPTPYPFPGGGRTTTKTVPAPDLPPYGGPQIHYGTVDKVAEKRLVIVTTDKRFITFDLFKETEVWREDEQVKLSDLQEGDTVRVEADRSPKGFLSATRIFIDDPPLAEGEEAPELTDEADPTQSEDRPTIRTGAGTWDYSDPPPREHIPVDSDDPGPPVLRRRTKEEAARIQRESAAKASEPLPQSPLASGEDVETFDVNTDPPPPDPLIERARAKAEAFTANLPNFICRQLVSRFESQSKPADWVALDIVEAEVAFEAGMESYQSIKVNGKLLKKQEMSALEGGSWTTGEFGTVLSNIFEPWSLTSFKFRQTDTSTRPKSKVYWFHVEQSRSNWEARIASVSYLPEYRGAIWIDEETARVLRIEMEAMNLPLSFPADTLELNIDYGLVRIGGQEHLLPVHSETLACMRGELRCNWNKIDFRNYRKFSAESTIFQTDSDIDFDNKEAPDPQPEPENQ